MPSARNAIIEQLNVGERLMQMFTADLSDQEYFVPAAEGTNHVAWIVGHIANAEDWAVNLLTGSPRRIPQALRDLLDGGSKCTPDASKYPSRREIDELFRDTRPRTLEALKSFDESRWDDPAPDDSPKDFFPTLGALWGLMGTHQFWHLGQVATCRSALGKKRVLF